MNLQCFWFPSIPGSRTHSAIMFSKFILILIAFPPSNGPWDVQAAVTPELLQSSQRILPARLRRPGLFPRSPIETPPTEYLPYPPPSNYPWPPGQSPATETPQPSEHNPPAGWYTGPSGASSPGPGGSATSSARPARSTLIPNLLLRTLSWIFPRRTMPKLQR